MPKVNTKEETKKNIHEVKTVENIKNEPILRT